MAVQPSGDEMDGEAVVTMVTSEPDGADNATLLAELEAGADADAATPAKPATGRGLDPDSAPEAPTEPTDAAEAIEDDEDTGEPELALADDDEKPEPEAAGAEDDDDATLAVEAAKDPDLARRREALRRTEQRQRQRLEQERSAFAAEQAQHRAGLDEVQQFKQLAARGKYDLYSVVRALGISDEDLEFHAQALIAHSPKYADKPEYKTAATKAMREREAADQAAATARELAELKSQLSAKEQAAAGEREVDALLARTLRRAGGDGAPVTKALAANSARAARDALTVTAAELAQRLRRIPTSKELLAAHEAKEIRALKLRGLAAPGSAPAKPSAKPAAPKPALAPSKPAAGGKPAPVPAPAAAPAATPLKPGERAPIPTVEELMHELQTGTQPN